MRPVLRRRRLLRSAVFINRQQEPAAGPSAHNISPRVTRGSLAGRASATVDHRRRERSLRVALSSSTASLCVVFVLMSHVFTLGFAARDPTLTSLRGRQSGQQRNIRDTPGGENGPPPVMPPLGAFSTELDSAPPPVETDNAVERNGFWPGSPGSSFKLTARAGLKQRISSRDGRYTAEGWTADGRTSSTHSHERELTTRTQPYLRGTREPVVAVATNLHTKPTSVPFSVGEHPTVTQSSGCPTRSDPRHIPASRLTVVYTAEDLPSDDDDAADVNGGIAAASVANVFLRDSAEGKSRTASAFAPGRRYLPARSASSSSDNAESLTSKNSGDIQQLLQTKLRLSPHRWDPEAAAVSQQSSSIPRYIKSFQRDLQSSAPVNVPHVRPRDLPLPQSPPPGPAPRLGDENYARIRSGLSAYATDTSFNTIPVAPSDFHEAGTSFVSFAAAHKRPVGGTTSHSAPALTSGTDARQIVTHASQCTGTKSPVRNNELARVKVGGDSGMALQAEDLHHDQMFREVRPSFLSYENLTTSVEGYSRQMRNDIHPRQVHDNSDRVVDATRASLAERELFRNDASHSRYSPDHAGKSRKNPVKDRGQSASPVFFPSDYYEGRQGYMRYEQEVPIPWSSAPQENFVSIDAGRGYSDVAPESLQMSPEESIDDCSYAHLQEVDISQQRDAGSPSWRHHANETYSIPPFLAPLYRESSQADLPGNMVQSGSDGNSTGGMLVPPRADSLPYQLTGVSKRKSKEFWRKLFSTRERLKRQAFKMLHRFPYSDVSPCFGCCRCDSASPHLNLDAGAPPKQEDAADSNASERETDARVSAECTSTETDKASTGHPSIFGDACTQRSYACSRSSMSSDYSASEPLVSIWGPRPARMLFNVVSFKNKYDYDSKSEERKIKIDKLIQRMMRVELWLASLPDDFFHASSSEQMNSDTQLNATNKNEAKEPGRNN